MVKLKWKTKKTRKTTKTTKDYLNSLFAEIMTWLIFIHTIVVLLRIHRSILRDVKSLMTRFGTIRKDQVFMRKMVKIVIIHLMLLSFKHFQLLEVLKEARAARTEDQMAFKPNIGVFKTAQTMHPRKWKSIFVLYATAWPPQ